MNRDDQGNGSDWSGASALSRVWKGRGISLLPAFLSHIYLLSMNHVTPSTVVYQFLVFVIRHGAIMALCIIHIHP